jgi:hypothetical protein
MGSEKGRIASALKVYYPDVFGFIERRDMQGLNPLCNKICYDARLSSFAYNQRRYPPIYRAGPVASEDLGTLEDLAKKVDQTDRIFEEHLTDPIRSLLFVALWKDGDLKRIRDLYEGARDSVAGKPYEIDSHSKAWYSLGRHWGSGGSEPLLDKNVVRAYLVYREGFELVSKKIKSPDRDDFRDYHDWLVGKELDPDGLFVVHKTLFTLGQATKSLN